MILSAICLGMIIQFASPLGGIIFAIEISTSSFQVRHMPKFFVGACFSSLIVNYIHRFVGVQTDLQIDINEKIHLPEIFLFVILGVFIGLTVSLFLLIFNRYFKLRQKTKFIFLRNRYLYVSIVSLMITGLSFYHNGLRAGYKAVLFQLTAKEHKIDPNSVFKNISLENRGWNWILELGFLFLMKHLMVLGFSTCSIPNGIMTPTIVLGLFFGRMYGEILAMFSIGTVSARVFALAGAAAYLTAMTRVFFLLFLFYFKNTFFLVLIAKIFIILIVKIYLIYFKNLLYIKI